MSKFKTLEDLVAAGRNLLDRSDPVVAHDAFVQWDAGVAEWLDQKYPGTGLSASWSSQSTSPLVVGGGYNDGPGSWKIYKNSVLGRLKWLSGLGATSRSLAKRKDSATVSRKVFVVHGRDVAARESVARFLQNLELEPIILHEQPNEGRTIIEKFEKYADVGFAVVILTADDIGRLGNGAKDERRARQNVILELGFFLGSLGRKRVCPLYEVGVTVPSDYDGVAYVPLDENGGWKLQLARELTSAGLAIDMNRAI